MKNQKFRFVSCFIIFILGATQASAALTPRLKALKFDKGKVENVMLTPGLATVLIFPCDIDEAIVGRDQDLKASVSPTTKKQLTLFLSSRSSEATNLLVRCGDKHDLFVFDIVPSRMNHQDVVKVSSYFGFPEEADMKLKLLDSSEKLSSPTVSHRIYNVTRPTLIKESK